MNFFFFSGDRSKFEDFSSEFFNCSTNGQIFLHFCSRKNWPSIKERRWMKFCKYFLSTIFILLHFNFAKFPVPCIFVFLYPRIFDMTPERENSTRGMGILHVMSNNWMVYGWNFCIFISVIYWTLRLQTKCSIIFHVCICRIFLTKVKNKSIRHDISTR